MELNFPETFDNEFVKEYNQKIYNEEYQYNIHNIKGYEYQQTQIDSIIRIIKDEIEMKIYPNIYEELHELASERGGFLTANNRRYLYRYIITNLYELNKYKYPQSNEIVNDSSREYKLRDIIIKDCERTVLKTFTKNFTSITKEDTAKYINNLKYFVRKSISDNYDIEYNQGYHDICLFFMLLFAEEGMSLANKFAKLFLYYFLNPNYSQGSVEMIQLSDISTNILNNKKICLPDENNSFRFPFTISWIKTIFTNKNSNIFHQFQLFDYFLTRDLGHIFVASSMLILKDINNIPNTNKDDSSTNVCMYFQDLNVPEKVNDAYLKDINRIDSTLIMSKALKELYKMDKITYNNRYMYYSINNGIKKKKIFTINWILIIWLITFLILLSCSL